MADVNWMQLLKQVANKGGNEDGAADSMAKTDTTENFHNDADETTDRLMKSMTAGDGGGGGGKSGGGGGAASMLPMLLALL